LPLIDADTDAHAAVGCMLHTVGRALADRIEGSCLVQACTLVMRDLRDPIVP
jgi:hypothetical protein